MVFKRLRKDIPNLSCPSGNKINLLCINGKCKNALRCFYKNCPYCGLSIHSNCSLPVSLVDLTTLVNYRAKAWGDILVDFFSAEE